MTEEKLDPRLNAFRDDIAALELEGRVHSKKFIKGERKEIQTPTAPLRREPRADAPLDTEVFYGEQVKVYQAQNDWAWVQSFRDAYVGYLPASTLADPARPATHFISEPSTHIYPGPDMKLPPLSTLPMNARLRVKSLSGDFAELEDIPLEQGETGHFIFARHLTEHPSPNRSFVEIAEQFVGTPYLWGGCTYYGIDCSGLVQTSLLAAGYNCLRDTDMQEKSIGQPVEHDCGKGDLKRGDLIFWRGHVGILINSDMLLHANAHHMQTVIEPYEEARLRIAGGDTGHVTSIRRI